MSDKKLSLGPVEGSSTMRLHPASLALALMFASLALAPDARGGADESIEVVGPVQPEQTQEECLDAALSLILVATPPTVEQLAALNAELAALAERCSQ